MQTLAHIEHHKTRQFREIIEIEKQGLLNKRDDAISLPAVWKTIIQKPRKLPVPRTSNNVNDLPLASNPISNNDNNDHNKKIITSVCPYKLRSRK